MATERVGGVVKVLELMDKADTTPQDMQKFYAEYCKTYDKDFLESGYSGPIKAVEHLVRKLKEYGRTNDVRILDVGCGTGLVGEQLHKHGYKNIDGIDRSPEMLQLAKAKGIYGSLHEGTVGSPGCKDLGVAANQYDAAISVGVFLLKHVSSDGFNDLVHAVKPGGMVCFTPSDPSLYSPESTYQEKMTELEQQGKWKLITKDYNPSHLAGYGSWCFMYQIL